MAITPEGVDTGRSVPSRTCVLLFDLHDIHDEHGGEGLADAHERRGYAWTRFARTLKKGAQIRHWSNKSQRHGSWSRCQMNSFTRVSEFLRAVQP